MTSGARRLRGCYEAASTYFDPDRAVDPPHFQSTDHHERGAGHRHDVHLRLQPHSLSREIRRPDGDGRICCCARKGVERAVGGVGLGVWGGVEWDGRRPPPALLLLLFAATSRAAHGSAPLVAQEQSRHEEEPAKAKHVAEGSRH